MICYVSYATGSNKKSQLIKAQKTLRYLQEKDPINCYICPLLTFLHLEETRLKPEDLMELRLDLLMCADRLIVASDISRGVQMEIDFAKLVKMEVMRLDENGELRPFTE